MLYQFSVQLPYTAINLYIEALSAVGIFNYYYEEPIYVTTTSNGYGYETKQQQHIPFYIFAEPEEVENLPDSYTTLIAKQLQLKPDDVKVEIIDDQLDQDPFQTVDLANGWVICYDQESVNMHNQKNVIQLDPQAAFGTGLHETTQDCLRIILDQSFRGRKVLDLGTGSGILSVAAALKGAETVIAVDREAVEREVLLQFGLNELDTNLTVEQADILADDAVLHESGDWIFINIGAEESIALINQHDLLKRTNHLLLSGIVEWNYQSLVELVESGGFTLQQNLQINEWMTFYFSK
ncbi:hypothetical protein Pryu01_02341 [Paraliobacillus ryukyuensis]|uniref:[LSU ribosomal protein L11P]-lysine N-methyltransferase n=1 Tax=Paraliobacillus ryukyuensis TaxID=200904 RepID=A0A366DWV9_9BACI|nr:50S ribosomal protein L11 methyltransferase [Paraliobacillus ryukyuensis]RBO94557.1 [LSU ribosomal protein L11P]-lysine N-methyltransferase [Paraliobacillus ryukyuensis]